MKTLGRIVVGTLFVLVSASAARAQATRTWVSGVGDDANPCSRTAPCKTFAGAISQTAPDGEMNVLDPGGFGGVTVNKSLTIDGHPFEAGVLVSGTSGITVAAGTTDTVTLRGLDIFGVSGAISGVRILTAANVNIEDSTIEHFNTAGIQVAGNTGGRMRVNIYNCLIRNNAGDGVQILPTLPQFVALSMNNDRLYNNGTGGVNIASNASTTASITHCVMSVNGTPGSSQGGLIVQNGNVIATDND